VQRPVVDYPVGFQAGALEQAFFYLVRGFDMDLVG
jgi:hypothetical protein